MLKIEIDMDAPGVPEDIHEILSNMTQNITSTLEIGEVLGNVYDLDGNTVGSWAWE